MKIKNQKGITLIALVITIIVLLILAGVSISSIMDENGILTKAKESKTKTKVAEVEEMAGLIASEYAVDNDGEGPSANYIISELISRNYIEESQVVDNGVGKEEGIIKVEGKEIVINGSVSREEIISETLKYFTVSSAGYAYLANFDDYYETDFPLATIIIPETVNGITVTRISNHIMPGTKVLELPETVTDLDWQLFLYASDLEELKIYSNLKERIDSMIAGGRISSDVTITYLDE